MATPKKNTGPNKKSERAPRKRPAGATPLPLKLPPGYDRLATDMQLLFVSTIKDIYWAENHLLLTLPKIGAAASLPPLKRAINEHLAVTQKHVFRLEKIFSLLDISPQAKKSDAMQGLAMEGEAVINSTRSGTPARDMGLIMASRRVENYEMAAYQGLIILAENLGLKEIVSLLEITLAEELAADSLLTTLSENNF